jgi:ABC-type spermidine/putrescine transport system permease subunit I
VISKIALFIASPTTKRSVATLLQYFSDPLHMELEAYSRNVNPDLKILLFSKHFASLQRALAVKVCPVIIAAVMSYCLRRTFAKLVKAAFGGQN